MFLKSTARWILLAGICQGLSFAQTPIVFPQLGQMTASNVLSSSAALAFSRDGATLASSSNGNSIKLWQTETGRELLTLSGHTGAVTSLAFLPSGQELISGSDDKTLRLWDLRTGKNLRVITGHQDAIRFLAISPDGSRVASLERKALKVWELRTGLLLRTMAPPLPSGDDYAPPFVSVIFSLDGAQVIASTMRGSLFAWEISSGRLKNQTTREDVFLRIGAEILGFAPDGRLYASDVTALVCIDLAKKKGTPIPTKSQPVFLTADGKHVLCHSVMDRNIKVMDIETRQEVLTLPLTENAVGYVLSPDGRFIAVSGFNDTLIMYDGTTGKQIQDFASQARVPGSGSFSADGNFITLLASQKKATSKSEYESIARRWNLKTARVEKEFNYDETMKHISNSMSSAKTDEERIKALALYKEHTFYRYEDPQFFVDTAAHKAYRLEVPYRGNTVTFWQIPENSQGHFMDVPRESWMQLNVLRPHALPITGEALSCRLKLAATGSEDKTIKLFEFPGGRLLKTFTGHLGSVTSIAFSPDGARLLSCSSDGTARLWDIAKGAEIAQFISFSDGEWITITPEGYFSASEKGERYLNVRLGAATYGIENYRETFYRPDLVKLALEGGSLSGFRNLAQVKQPPRVAIVQTLATTESPDCTLTLSLEDQGGGIGDVRIFLNGSAVLLESARGIQIAETSSKGSLRSYPLKLSEGRNSLRAVAFNVDNTMQSNGASWEVTATFKARQKPVLHALVVGIQEFRNSRLQLKYAVADANLFADAIQQGATGLFDSVKLARLTTKETTTKEALVAALKGYRALSPDDLFILYVASHGTVDEGEYFLIPSNVGALSTQRLRADALSQSELKELVANIPSTKKLIIIDTCNAGQLGQALQSALLTRGMSEDTAIKVLSRAVGSTILSASTSMQQALEGYQGHGLFTWALVEGLKGKADKGRTGFVKTTDLATYVEEEVPELAERLFKHDQFPTVSISGQGFPVGKTR